MLTKYAQASSAIYAVKFLISAPAYVQRLSACRVSLPFTSTFNASWVSNNSYVSNLPWCLATHKTWARTVAKCCARQHGSKKVLAFIMTCFLRRYFAAGKRKKRLEVHVLIRYVSIPSLLIFFMRMHDRGMSHFKKMKRKPSEDFRVLQAQCWFC